MDPFGENSKKKCSRGSDKKIRRFSKIEDERDVPFFKYYNPQPDPVLKQEHRKMKSSETPFKKPKLKMKCITCKEKKEKAIDKEVKKIEQYVAPISRKQQRENEERHRKQKDKFFICKKELIRLPSPIEIAEPDERKKLAFESAAKTAKVVPEKISMTESTMKWPQGLPAEELVTRVPKSKIYINKVKKKPEDIKFPPVDSIDYIYNEQYRQQHPWYEMYRGQDSISFFPDAPAPSKILTDDREDEEDEEEEDEENADDEEEQGQKQVQKQEEQQGQVAKVAGKKMVKEEAEDTAEEDILITDYLSEDEVEVDSNKQKSRSLSSNFELKRVQRDSKLQRDSYRVAAEIKLVDEVLTIEEEMEAEAEEEEEEYYSPSTISKISAATSIASDYKMKYPADDQYDTGSLVPTVINRILQKYQRDSEVDLAKQERQPYKKGTLKSHSTTKVHTQPKSFYFGVKEGAMHYGDPTFSEKSRFRQGLPMCVTAYVFSFVKPPPRWKTKDIDMVLELGDKLYLKSLEIRHLHETPRILQPEELYDIVELADKKIKYKIHEPDIAGFTRSVDPKIYNLLKGLTLFFKRNRSGIFQTYNTNILIFRQKHFFVFDPEPRTGELYSKDNGNAILASFYDLQSVLVMLLERGKLDNWPYIISKIAIHKIATVVNKKDNISLSSEFREESLFKIVNPFKAVIRGALCIDDPCFGDMRTKQALAVATIALVYTHVTPSCAWHKKTVNKIIMVANQFHIECLKGTEQKDLKLENVPAFFTIGPLMIEIKIYANQYAGLMYRKTVCLFAELLTKCFCHHTSVIVEIDRFALAVWKQRETFYSFDPYSRDREGYKSKEGVACVTMNINLETLLKTVLHNFSVKDYIFRIHVLKVVKINRDPEYGKIPRSLINSEQSIVENIKISDRRAFTPKNITVDKTEIAAHTTFLEEQLDPSITEVGSFVGSLDEKYVTNIPICPSKAIIKFSEPPVEKIFDLDSPSLSDTQIEKDRPSPLHADSFEFKLLDEILKEEAELTKLMDLGEGGERDYLQLIDSLSMDTVTEPVEMQDEMIQKGADFGIIDKRKVLTNTDLMGLYPVEKQVLELNKPSRRHKTRRPKAQPKIQEEAVDINQTSELAKPSNFITLPDGSEILYGTRNIANLGEDYDAASAFAAVVAIVMAKKYTLNTWSQEVVDAILDYGFAVYKSININFSDVPKIEIPKLTIGTNSFHVAIDYVFDSLLAQNILEQCLEKLIFRDRESALVVTQNYCCAVFKKRYLYYMFDPFGNNLVGLGEGPDNSGVACMFRFKSVYSMVSRFLYNNKQRENIEPTEASRFIISTVDVKVILPPALEKIPRREKQVEGKVKEEPQFETNPEKVEKEREKQKEHELKARNKVGYQRKEKFMVIEGSEVLTEREGGAGKIKECHFVCICALIAIFGRPVKTWDTKRIDYVSKIGKTLFGYVDNMNFADKRNITNLLLDKYFFDMVVKRITIADPKGSKNFNVGLDNLLIKNKFLLIQFPNCCYVLYKGVKTIFHLFDPYGVVVEGSEPKSCWIKFQNKSQLQNYLRRLHKDNASTFFFYTINISHIKKASKKSRLQYKLRVTQIKKKKKQKALKIFNESEDWLTEYPIPWTRMKKQLASGVPRGTPSHKWFSWDVEYPGDLYSMVATKHQSSTDFPAKSRNKQTIANCIVAIAMTEVYDFTEWNSQIMDSVLTDGDSYFRETFKKVKEKNYEVKVEDFPLTVNVFPYSINIEITPLIEGTMFLVRATQFNVAKALRYFFEASENRCGIICCNNGRTKTKYLAFGRIREGEFFMFDCQTIGPPMFVDRFASKAYILRCVTLNRLIQIMAMTLRGGDFFIYSVSISEDQGEKEIKTENLDGQPEPSIKSQPDAVIKTEPEEGGEGT